MVGQDFKLKEGIFGLDTRKNSVLFEWQNMEQAAEQGG